MGNIISLDTIGERISMSNGLTSVFIDVLGLSGTHLAKTAAEKRMIVWFLEKDQSAVGWGAVGFDVSEMPWADTDFDDMKRFMLDVIEGARRKDGWGFLDYQPNEDLLFPCLDQFYKLISDMDLSMFNQEAARKWLHDTMDVPDDPIVCGYPRCPKHPVLLTVFGCHLCNN